MTPDDSAEREALARTAVERYQAPLLRYAGRLLEDPERARDVVQDTFVRLLRQPPSAVAGHLAEWLFTVCRHRAVDLQRKENRMTFFADGEAENLVSAELAPGRAAEKADTREALLRLIDRLPPRQQELVRLKFQNGFSYQEIARITHLSVSNVGFLLHTAVSHLRREWRTLQAPGFAARPSPLSSAAAPLPQRGEATP